MTTNGAAGPPRHLRTPEAARFLGLSDRTLEKHRSYGTGPIYRKIGGRVVYTLDDLQAWSERGARTSTSDPNAQVVSPAKRHAASAPAFIAPVTRGEETGR
ncbi:AlpA family transcriptional regulator [Caulobacter sp. FWC2]|uniref:helix-turn-helix transcriptional regulator n=1 Tax=Caulobacter sp. FWC2 TaxID=69664 RepID=UPI000C1570F6|nr:helix-turn-helix domain-containing protein [Caulobacter sp. FWC2]PIB92602.1 DNA-binding protein [Caulobacter sp. FWC2]